MSVEAKSDLELEIAHVLFIDTVGYSKLVLTEQRRVLETLGQIVRGTRTFQAAESASKLVCLPTGDGMAMVFADDGAAPLRCAMEISRAVRGDGGLPLRMGIHSGPVSRVIDVNGRVNIAGAGINKAQRVMDCADAGHILLSKRTADDLAESGQWLPFLHDLGECKVKHGAMLGLTNFFGDDVGNPELPSLCKKAREEQTSAARRRARRGRLLLGIVLLAMMALSLAAFLILQRKPLGASPSKTAAAIREKSIAVLPFANLSDEKQNAYLADGIVDEILTDLAKVADLKVISRTSVMQYASGGQLNLRNIAAQLGVVHLLVGSVQRSGPQLRVNAQLIDAVSGAQIWAQRYDRGLADIFSVESELAEAIVGQLRAKLSPEEKAAIANQPTSDLDAFEFYTKARDLLATSTVTQGEEKRLQAAQLLEQAIARDPAFLRAYCTLVRVHSEIYLLGMDHTPARLRMAATALQNAVRLQADAGETHLASAFLRYCQLDYDGARQELASAQHALPNEPFVFELAAYMDRRQGRWQESERNLRHALELDPRNFYFLQQMLASYERLRRFDDMLVIAERALAVAPNDPGARSNSGFIDLFARADTKPLRATFSVMLEEDPKIAQAFAVELIKLALRERDFSAADRALAGMEQTGGLEGAFSFPRAWYAGLIARAKGDVAGARAAFAAARAEVAKELSGQSEFPQPLSILAMIDAALGNKEQALAQGRRASELLPVTQDAITGADVLTHLAITYAWCGDKDDAIETLSTLSKIPSDVNYGTLRLDPIWDSLRGDPRFEQIVASLAPKEKQ
jgi:TolB-like protein/Tfp pilus assembly protein PilF